MDTSEQASLAALVAAYCGRPLVRRALGLAEETTLRATVMHNHLPAPATVPHDEIHVMQTTHPRYWHYHLEAGNGRQWVAQFTVGSALGLSSSKQTAYAARALRLVENARIAPEVCWVDATLYHLPYGFLLHEWLSAGAWDWHDPAQITGVARALARLHNLPLPVEHGLRVHASPLHAQLEVLERAIAEAGAQTAAAQSWLAAARTTLVHAARFAPTALVHGAPERDNWRVQTSTPSPLLAGLGTPQHSFKLVDWALSCIDDPTHDVAAVIAWTTAAERAVPWTAAEQERFVQAYLAARPMLDAAEFHAKVLLRLPFLRLQWRVAR